LTDVAQGVELADLVRQAVGRHRGELSGLAFMPELRYDRSVFPTSGQYDWFSAQVLYCLVRELRPLKIVEFSTSSGFSTTFSAMALRANGEGVIHSVDIDDAAQRSAGNWLRGQGLAAQVELHLGDCRDVVPGLLDGTDLLFIDSLHSFDLAEWYLTSVVPALPAETLVHVHDIMPPEARVRIHGGPPFAPAPPPPRPPLAHLVKRFVWLSLRLRKPNPFPARRPTEILPLHLLEVHPPVAAGELPTIDGNYFEEAVLLRELLRDVDQSELLYLHRLMSMYPELEPQRFAHLDRIQRQDRVGKPLEWNDTLWCRAGVLQRAATTERLEPMLRQLRRRYQSGRARQP
jgi:hypothetical protein